MIALFARSNHPVGYGYGDGRAHGYSVVGFRCKDSREVDRVVRHVRMYGIDLPDKGRRIFDEDQLKPSGVESNHHYKNVGYPGVIRWYSGGPGDWDYLFSINGNTVGYEFDSSMMWSGSRGDNRFARVYDASELLRTD